MIDRKTDYALRAAVYLALHCSRDRTATAEEIAEGSGAPRKYLGRILLSLKKSALVGSTAGRGGGYWLMRRPELISVEEIVSAVAEEKDQPLREDGESGGVYRQPRHIVSSRVKNALHEVLSSMSLAELASASVRAEENRGQK